MEESAANTTLSETEWSTIRDFTEDGNGHTLPRYEAKLLRETDRRYIENEFVLVRVTQPSSRREKRYRIPTDVFQQVAQQLP